MGPCMGEEHASPWAPYAADTAERLLINHWYGPGVHDVPQSCNPTGYVVAYHHRRLLCHCIQRMHTKRLGLRSCTALTIIQR